MLSLQGSELHYLIVGINSEENPEIQILNLDRKSGLKKLELLQSKHFKTVVLTYYSEFKTLVPEGLYEKGTESNYLEFVFSEESVKGIPANDYIRQLESHLIYIENDEINKIKAVFPELRIRHGLSVLLEAHMRSSIASEKIEISVYGQEDKIDIIVSDRSKLLLNNSFKVFNPEDFTYYIVYVMDVLGISLKETLVRICGNVDAECLTLLKKYCSNSGFHKFGYDPNIGKNISKDEYSKEAILLNQYQCV